MWRLLLILGCLCFLLHPSQQQPESTKGKSRPHPRPDIKPPPVDTNYTTDCNLQRAMNRDITCNEDGSFTEIQCKDMFCFCVNTTTGMRLNKNRFSRMEAALKNCSEEFTCPALVGCDKICKAGYQIDSNGCSTCQCERPPSPKQCMTISELILVENCNCACITIDGSDGSGSAVSSPRRSMMAHQCPKCDQICNEDPPRFIPVAVERCSIVYNFGQCPAGTSLKSAGRYGDLKCVPGLSDSATCEPSLIPRQRGPRGADKRRMAGEISLSVTPCMNTSVCMQVGYKMYKCQPENTNSACVGARASDPNIKCDSNGNFKPLQCSPTVVDQGTMATDVFSGSGINEITVATDEATKNTRRIKSKGSETCTCVDVKDGMAIGEPVIVQPGEDKPKCDDVFKDCQVPGLHSSGKTKSYKVSHGEDYFDVVNCRTCECVNGNATAFCSEPANCSVLTPDSTANCTLENGDVIQHSTTVMIGCDICGCKDGRLRCSHKRHCKDKDNKNSDCDQCRNEPVNPVCGPDGRNHLSMCTAIYCAGISPVDLLEGPCPSQDVCEQYPCADNEVCVRKGAVTCMSFSGCTADQHRECVAVDSLLCPIESNVNTTNSTDDDIEDPHSATSVCGSDNVTYNSLCELLQTTANVYVLHTGRCDDPECNTGQVCGSDGVTYSSACVLETLASTRVDYPGSCEIGSSADDICKNAKSNGRCTVNSNNCQQRVIPEDGCCPICGGAVSVVIDRQAITDVSQTNNEIQTLDTFAGSFSKDIVFKNVAARCKIEVTPLDTGGFQFILTALKNSDSKFCYDKSKEIAVRVNTGKLYSGGSLVDGPSTPQVFDFAMAAIASTQVADGGTITATKKPDSNNGGAVGLLGCLSVTTFITLISASFILT